MAQIQNDQRPSVRRSTKKKGPSPLVKYYLLAYNVFSALGWSYVLLLTLMHLSGLSPMPPSATHSSVSSLSSYIPASLARFLPSSTLQFRHASHSPMVRKLEKILPSELLPLLHRACTTYAAVGSQTAFVQSFAALEVLHCLLGFVRSPIGTTGAQVASRLYLVWGITALFPNTRAHPLYASMVLSWSITEVIRYTFYAFSLLGREPYPLLYLRYTLFYVLYPTGAGSEAGLIYASLPAAPPAIPLLSNWYGWKQLLPLAWPFSTPRWAEVLHDDFRVGMFLIWWPGLYVMYTYMMKQRRKVLGAGPGRTIGTKPKSL
ncbi:hypothetical protein AcW1_008880 [Taiwanofungus camphoratus]|nr:hypothetical protein AcW1_008880 [Antrodia cinnamomea]KAI0958983.1 hypothetical protein AcV7_004647 [Antrodia cinnamomea]